MQPASVVVVNVISLQTFYIFRLGVYAFSYQCHRHALTYFYKHYRDYRETEPVILFPSRITLVTTSLSAHTAWVHAPRHSADNNVIPVPSRVSVL